MSRLDIGPATLFDFNRVMKDPVLFARVVEGQGGKPPKYNPDHYFATKYGQYIMLFTVWELSPGIYEAHIAIPSGSIKKCRGLALASTKWLFEVGFPEAEVIIINCPRGKIANFAIKLGYTKVSESPTHIVFMGTRPLTNNLKVIV